MNQKVADETASCQALGLSVLSQLSSSITQLHLQAVDAVVLAAADRDSWQSLRNPMTWPDAPGCAAPLLQHMLTHCMPLTTLATHCIAIHSTCLTKLLVNQSCTRLPTRCYYCVSPHATLCYIHVGAMRCIDITMSAAAIQQQLT